MEFPNIGEKCAIENCQQLDFLPIECEFCKNKYCKDHNNPWVHKCSKLEEKILSNSDILAREKIKWQIRCSFESCSNKELMPVICEKCSKAFCLSHRHPDEHKCSSLKKAEEEIQKTMSKEKQRIEESKKIQAKVAESINKKLEKAQEEGGGKAQMAKKLAYMKLKMKAIGIKSVPQNSRLYFTVTCPNNQNLNATNILMIFVNKEWSTGKVIDFLAKEARIKNRNNQPAAPKLYIFKKNPDSKSDDPIIKVTENFDITFAQILEEHFIEDGDDLILKYVE